MNQAEQVVKTIEELGGFATLGQLYREVNSSDWKTKTPHASIRRIVQTGKEFFKIKAGLWALKSHQNRLPKHILPSKEKDKKQSDHYYYQGLLLQIGNLKKHQTFAPNQDKNKKFLNTKLGNLRTLSSMPRFGYDKFIKHAQTIDVSWFNSREMPEHFFEIEHSTSMERSLIKFNELLDFNVKFCIVADKSRKREFEEKIKLGSFYKIRNRVNFFDYENVSRMHSLQTLESDLSLF